MAQQNFEQLLNQELTKGSKPWQFGIIEKKKFAHVKMGCFLKVITFTYRKEWKKTRR